LRRGSGKGEEIVEGRDSAEKQWAKEAGTSENSWLKASFTQSIGPSFNDVVLQCPIQPFKDSVS
jgi:hypothetical protein